MKLKKLAALLLGFAMVLGLTGCLGNVYTKVLTIEGEEISSGLYLLMQMRAYSQAEGLVENTEKDVLKQKIDGQSASSWIQEKAVDYCKRYVAVQKLARAEGVKLSDASWEGIESSKSMWEYEYFQEYYTTNGIGYDTYVYNTENAYLEDELFLALYSPDGKNAVSKEEMIAAYGEQNAHVRVITLSYENTYTDEESGESFTDDYASEVVAFGNEMLALLESGERTMEEIATGDLADIYEKQGREYEEDSVDTYLYTSYINYESEYYEEELLTQLKGQAVGDFGVYEGELSLMLYEKIDTFESDEEFEEMSGTVVSALYSEVFDEWLTEQYKDYPVSKVFGAQWFYRPSKVK